MTELGLSPIIVAIYEMVKIRLRREGGKSQPSYRLVVADAHDPQDGSFIKILGYYNPLTDPPTIVVAEEETLAWLGRGAQPTKTAAKLLARLNILDKSHQENPKPAPGGNEE